MPARRAASLCVPVDGRSGAELRCYPQRAPLLTICAGRPALLVTFTEVLVPIFGCVLSTRGFGLISSVCAPSPYAQRKSNTSFRKEKPPDAGRPTRRERHEPVFGKALHPPL